MFKTICLLALLSITFVVVLGQENQEAPASSSSSFQCYTCNSLDDSSCAGDKNEKYSNPESHKKNCDNGETFCRKIVQNVEGEKSVIRQCAKELYKSNYTGCYKTAGKSTQHVCTCQGTLCNSGVTLKASTIAFGLSVIISSLFFF